MTSQEQRDGLVPHLPVRQAGGAFVARRDEQRQEVSTARSGPLPLGDHPLDRRVELPTGPVDLTVLGERQAHRDREQGREDPGEVGQRCGQGLTDRLRCVGFHVGVEQGSSDHREREAGHLAMDVQGLAHPPALGGPFGMGHHHVRVGLHPSVVEDGLDQPPPPTVDITLAGQQVLAKDALGGLHGRALHEVLVAGDEDVLDVVGVNEQPGLQAGQPQPHHVAGGSGPLQQAERIASPCPERLQRTQARTARSAHLHRRYGAMFWFSRNTLSGS